MHSIRSDVEPVDPSLVPLFISAIDIAQYINVAILTLLVYNTAITMDKEVNRTWNSEFWTEKHLAHCREDLMTVLLIDYILLIRVLALYHEDKRLATCLRTVFGLEAAFGLGLLIYTLIYEEIAVWELAEGVTFCGVNRTTPKVWGALYWLVLVAAPMLYAIILMILALYKAAEHWRVTAGFSQFTLVKVLIQDQAIYFIMYSFLHAYPVLHIPNVLLAYLLNTLGTPSLLCVLGSHLLVHLKEAGERGANGGTSYRMQTMSNIEFS
ncbi:hypothetical protein DFH11DRAFT_1512040 [Phellopilus nigrolimitatus]|nr:hypothetical protein DFH11DRAFT_1512040 [Phellopilus nigrolimitatus]